MAQARRTKDFQQPVKKSVLTKPSAQPKQMRQGVERALSEREVRAPYSASAPQINQLQRSYGNRAVQRLMQQTTAPVGREGGVVEGDLPRKIESARGGGQHLDAQVGAKMGQALGADLSRVKVHTDAAAHKLNRSLSAKAFTLGSDVFFSQGAYDPGSTSGQELLAHELSHVVQQGAGKTNKVQTKLKVGPANDAYEQAADRTAKQVTGAKTGSGPAPHPAIKGEAAIQRRLEFDGKAVQQANELEGDLGDDFATLEPTVVQLINLRGPGIKLNKAQLSEVHAFLTQQIEPASRPAKVALVNLLSNGAWNNAATMGPKSLEAANTFNNANTRQTLKQFGDFLRANPNLSKNLAAAGVGWELMSKNLFVGGMGGGAVIEDKIHLQNWVLGEGEGFLRMAVHEAGHATFQRLLITGSSWTEQANKGEKLPDERALVADGKEFYEAWKVLREKPEYFFITDMPGDSVESKGMGRAGYLAKQFTEFCAESFMHLALKKDDLQEHVRDLPETEPEVRGAWQKAMGVLTRNESQILGSGQEGDQAAATLRRLKVFKTTLEKLEKSVKNPEAPVENLEEVKDDLLKFKQAWVGLSESEQHQHRLDSLRVLDMYIMKVQRRRPAQQHLGAELGFQGL